MMAIQVVVRQDGWRKFRDCAVLSVVASIIAAHRALQRYHLFQWWSAGSAEGSAAERLEEIDSSQSPFTYLVVGAIQKRLAEGSTSRDGRCLLAHSRCLYQSRRVESGSRTVLGGVRHRHGRLPGCGALRIYSTPDKLRAVLLDARSIVTSNPRTPRAERKWRACSERLGIVEAMQRKTLHRNFLDGGAELITKGGADLSSIPGAR